MFKLEEEKKNQPDSTMPSGTASSDGGEKESFLEWTERTKANVPVQRVLSFEDYTAVKNDTQEFNPLVYDNSSARKTSGGYYSFNGPSGEDYDRAVTGTQKYGELYKKSSDVVTAASYKKKEFEDDLEAREKELASLGLRARLDRTGSVAALYNQRVTEYNAAYGDYKNWYDGTYAPIMGDHQLIGQQFDKYGTAYMNYNTEAAKEYDNWKTTVRDEKTVEAELATARERAENLRKEKAEYDEDKRLSDTGYNSWASWENSEDPVLRARYAEYKANREKLFADAEAKDKEYEDAQEEVKLLEEELGYSRGFKYEAYKNAADFEEKSKYNPQYLIDETYSKINLKYDDAHPYYGDEAHENRLTNEEYSQITPEEQAIYNYLYATNKAEADKYYEYLYPQLTARQREAETKAVLEWANKSDFNKVLANVGTIVLSPLKAVSYLGQAADLINTGKIDQNAGYNKFSYLNSAVRENTTKNWGEVGTFTYQTGMSMLDFLWNAFLTGGLSGGGDAAENLSLLIMGAGAAADTVIEQKDRGMDDARAFTLGTVAGIAEVVTEKVSLEALLSPDLTKGKLRFIVKNALAEGSEEVGSDLINYFADDLYDLISGQENSKWKEMIRKYKEQDPTCSDAKAFGLAIGERAKEVGLDFAGGLLSGGVLAGVRAGAYTYQTSDFSKNRATGKALSGMELGTEDYQAIINEGLAAPEGSEARKAAEQMQVKLDAGKKVSNTEYGKLMRLNEAQIADETIGEGAGIIHQALEQVDENGKPSYEGAKAILNNEAALRILSENTDLNLTKPMSVNDRIEAVRDAVAKYDEMAVRAKAEERAAGTKQSTETAEAATSDTPSTGSAALDSVLRAISDRGTVTNKQAMAIMADRTMLDALSEITGIDLSYTGQQASPVTANAQITAVKNAAMQAAETLNEQNNAALQTEAVDNDAITNPAQSVAAPAVSPESSVGAATRGFVDNPNPGEMVPSQNKSVTTNPFLTDDEKLEYNPAHERISTAEQNRRADNMFAAYDDAGTNRNWDDVAADLMSKDAWTAVEQKAAQKIFEQYRKEARRTGDYEKLNAFAKAMAEIGRSEAGRSLQARKEFSRTGDGLVQQSIEILDNPKIDEDIRDAETKRILDASEEFDNAEVFNNKGEVDKAATMKNLADLVLKVAEARNNIKDRNDVRKTITWALDTVMKTGDVDFMRDLAWGSLVASIQDNIPIPASEAIKSLRRDFMLSKISTAMRNIVSNMTFDLIDGISRNISVPLDILVSKFTGTRSIAKTDIISKAKMKAQVDAFAKSFLEVAFNVSAEGAASGYGAAGNRTFRMSGGPVEQVLSRMEQYLNLAMYSTDQFQKGGIRESVQRGIDELYEKGLIKDESLREAGDIEMLYRTFQKDGKLASALKGFRDWLNNLSSGFVPGSFQLGDIIMPFVQVPANLVSAAVDYTPLGILKEAARLVVQSRNGTLTAAHQARMVQAIGRSLNGSAVIALAAIAKAIGALTVSDDGRDRDKDKTALDTQAGLSGTQLNLSALIRAFSGEDVTRQEGDLLVNIGFMDPLNALLTIGSLFHDEVTDEDGYKLGDLTGKSAAGIAQSLSDMPMMGAASEFYKNLTNSDEEVGGSRFWDAVFSYAGNQASSFIPNALKGIAQGTDPYQRDLYSKDSSFGRAFDSVLASIPGLRETLPVKQDSFGEDMDTGNWWLNFLNNNLLPGRVNQYSPRQEGIKTVLDAVSDATGEVGFYPDRYAPKTIDGHKLSYEEKRAYKKAYGDAYKEAMSETGDMSNLTIEEVTDILTNINSYARGTAKEAVTDGYKYKPSDNSYVRGSEALDSVGIPIADYYTYYKDIGDIKKKYDTTDERKKRVIEYINEHKTLTTEQKNYLWHEAAHFDSKSPWES